MAYLTGLSYAIIESRGAHDKLGVDTSAIIYQGQFYRFITGTLTFRTAGELIMGMLVFIHFSRRFEREMGTRKYCFWLTSVAVLSVAFQLFVAQVIFVENGLQYSGPYPTIGALVLLFHLYTPRLHPRFFGLFGIHFSEKTMSYAFCAQILLNRGYSSILASACGMVAAFLTTKTMAKQTNVLDFPDFLASIVSAVLHRFVDDPPTPIVAAAAMRAPRAARGAEVPQARRAAPTPPPTPAPPSDAAVEQLTSMGFDREAVLRALHTSQNNVQRAADILLTGS